MSIDLDVLEGLLKSAAPLPWESRLMPDYRGQARFVGWVGRGPDHTIARFIGSGGRSPVKIERDAAFVAATVNALPDLISAARERDALRSALEAFLKAGGANPALGMARFSVWSLPLLATAFDQATQALQPHAPERKD